MFSSLKMKILILLTLSIIALILKFLSGGLDVAVICFLVIVQLLTLILIVRWEHFERLP